ncbi:DUF1428 domain-containing protein [Flagellimonas sp.]|uniref:DUF1428 domain-containing protein n=1 Tax=Flagellimonas sp. TaxID=2058762 RepID=UPI003B520FFE
MTNYIDGFVFPIAKIHLAEYQKVAEKVAQIWKEYGAIAYFEFVGDDMNLEGTRSFMEAVATKEDEEVVLGWVVFPSKAVRDLANTKVPLDPRMAELVTPLVNPEKLIFDASRMVYGGFKPLVQSNR